MSAFKYFLWRLLSALFYPISASTDWIAEQTDKIQRKLYDRRRKSLNIRKGIKYRNKVVGQLGKVWIDEKGIHAEGTITDPDFKQFIEHDTIPNFSIDGEKNDV